MVRAHTHAAPSAGKLLPAIARGLFLAGLVFVALPVLRLGWLAVSDYFFLACMLIIAWDSLVRSEGMPVPVQKLLPGLILMWLGLILSALNAEAIEYAVGDLLKFSFVTLALGWAGCIMMVPRLGRRLCFHLWLLSCSVSALVALAQLVLGPGAPAYETVQFGRMSGLAGNPNGLGTVAAIAVPIAAHLSMTSRRMMERLLALVWLVLCAVAIVLSASYTALAIGVTCGGLTVLASARGRSLLMLPVLAIVGVVAVTTILQVHQDFEGQSFVQRFDALTHNDEDAYASMASRFDGFMLAWEESKDTAFLGSGALFSLGDNTTIDYVHNTYLMVLRGIGAVGLLGLVWFMLASGVLAWQNWRTRGVVDRGEKIAIGLAILGIYINGLSGPVLFQREYWIPFVALLACAQAEREGRRARLMAWRFAANSGGRPLDAGAGLRSQAR